ncbi:urease accessory protein UreD [Shimia sp. R9_3]|uniref:urease accessory protein UreD n=1 Tax=Shimia sp. R9_3 TaxID=2821113 RepID=UPI001ADC4002|nr:urease accessory protein UreD [Shimia sp. R9_3]MBO9399888.1 urease accessory protein UreD [Shimia sp. R9_3]
MRVKGKFPAERPESAITALTPISRPEPALPPTQQQPRAQGSADIRSKLREGSSVLDDLRLSGSSRVLFPHANYARGRTKALQAVLLNTAGGITGGDRFSVAAAAGTGSHLTVTTQAAERAYRSIDAKPGQLDSTLTLSENSQLDWLPQETILFDGASISRNLTVDMHETARFLMVEPLIFGRTAMGETVRKADIFDRITLTRGEKLLFADRIKLSGNIQAQLDRPTIAGGARAMATLLLVAPDAARHLDALRALLPATAGASVIRDGLLFARILAEDGHALRQSLIPALTLLHGADIPRTWML